MENAECGNGEMENWKNGEMENGEREMKKWGMEVTRRCAYKELLCPKVQTFAFDLNILRIIMDTLL